MKRISIFIILCLAFTAFSLNAQKKSAGTKSANASKTNVETKQTAPVKSAKDQKTEDLINRGKLAFMKKNYQKAEEFFTQAIENDKTDAESYIQRSYCYLYTNQFDKAVLDLDAAIKIAPEYPDNYNNRGLAYSYLGNIDKAMADFNKAIKLDPGFSEAYINRATAYIVMKKYDEAKADFKKAAKESANNPEFFLQRARLNQLTGAYKEAVSDYTKLLSLGVKSPKVYYNRANSYFKLNDYKKAIEDYTEVLKIDSNDVETLNNRAIAYEKLDMGQLALNDRASIEAFYERTKPNLDSINLRTITDSSRRFSIDAPPDWYAMSFETDSTIHFFIAKEPMDGSVPVLHQIAVTYVKRMPYDYKGSNDADLLKYWDDYTRTLVPTYGEYDIYSQKKGPYEGWSTTRNHIKVSAEKGTPGFQVFEFGMARQGQLIFGTMQAPEEEFLRYYQHVYDKILKTIKTINTKK